MVFQVESQMRWDANTTAYTLTFANKRSAEMKISTSYHVLLHFGELDLANTHAIIIWKVQRKVKLHGV